MAEEISEISVGQFDTVSQLIASSVSLQLAVIGLIIGIIIISVVYRKFSFWVKTQKFNHVRPHVARFARKIILPFLAIALISSVNMYIQVFELFDEESAGIQLEGELAPSEVFAKMLNTLTARQNVLNTLHVTTHAPAVVLLRPWARPGPLRRCALSGPRCWPRP